MLWIRAGITSSPFFIVGTNAWDEITKNGYLHTDYVNRAGDPENRVFVN